MPNNLVFNNSADQLKTSIYGSDGTSLKPIAVNSNGSISITATAFDIRNLASGKDTVDIGNTVTVQSTDLDIRNLVAGQDTVDVNTVGSILSNVTVQATDFEIRDLASGKDTVDIGNTVTVQSTDLDIRNLVAGQDTVDIGTVAGIINSNVSSRSFVEDNVNLGALTNTTGTTLEEDISTFTSYSYFIRNTGSDTVQITVEGSPVLDDSYYVAIESAQPVGGGASAIIATGKFIKYLRLRYTVANSETANVIAYFNGQV